MRIADLRVRRDGTSARAEARVVWEDSARPEFELFFQTAGVAAEDLGPEPEAFALACFLPAVRAGERRLRIEDELCPRFAEGLASALDLLGSWYGAHRTLAVEASGGFRAKVPRQPPRTALLFTGGVDSMHLLASNRAHLPRDHPASFGDALSLYGHLCADTDASPWYDRAVPALDEIAREAGAELVSVRTNLWRLAPDYDLVVWHSLSACLIAAAHLFRRRWTRISLATGRDVTREIPRGTHPLLDPFYGSRALEVRHDPIRWRRSDRLRALANAAPGLESLIVCQTYPAGEHLNCGACEKCLRTMTELLAIGRLAGARHFPSEDVTPGAIHRISIAPVEAPYWEETIPELAARGRDDLVAAIRGKVAEARRVARWVSDAGWRGRVRRLDRRYLGGRLLAIRQRLGRRRIAPAR